MINLQQKKRAIQICSGSFILMHPIRNPLKMLPDFIQEDHVDGLVLNAGGIGDDAMGEPRKSGVTLIAEINLLGHVLLVDSLVASGKLGKGSRIICSGSENARGAPYLGVEPPKWGHDVESFRDHLNGSAYIEEKYSPMVAYKYIKGIAALYFSAWAKRHPEIYTATVSPGGTSGTRIFDVDCLSYPKRTAIKLLF